MVLVYCSKNVKRCIMRNFIKMISCFVMLVLGVQLNNPFIAQAGPLEEYQLARNTYLYAIVCRAAYGDRIAQIATSGLLNNGWKMEHYFQTGDVDEARFFLAKNENYEGKDAIYLLGVSGTENAKDMKVNLDYGKAYFAGATIEEIQANAMIKPIPVGGATVHRGFLKYVTTILATKDGEKRLIDKLLEDPNKKVYMVGHSLGGAVVTLTAACLINMGVRPEQIEVITFGAPAIGNDVFAAQFENTMNLQRIVTHGDPIPSVLKDMVGGYRQFGKQVTWTLSDDAMRFPHDMVMYLDIAIKNYYNKISVARNLSLLPVINQKRTVGKQQFYIAPIINSLPDELRGEFPYMREALLDQYRNYLPGYDVDGDDSSSTESLAITLKNAAAEGCTWVLSAKLQGYRVKNEQGLYYLTLEQTIYQVSDGRPIMMFSFGTNTKNLTPLEAIMSDAMQVSENTVGWLEEEQKRNLK